LTPSNIKHIYKDKEISPNWASFSIFLQKLKPSKLTLSIKPKTQLKTSVGSQSFFTGKPVAQSFFQPEIKPSTQPLTEPIFEPSVAPVPASIPEPTIQARGGGTRPQPSSVPQSIIQPTIISAPVTPFAFPTIPIVPFIPFKRSPGGLGSTFSFRFKTKRKRTKAFNPTIRSAAFGIKGKSLKSAELTGLGERFTKR